MGLCERREEKADKGEEEADLQFILSIYSWRHFKTPAALALACKPPRLTLNPMAHERPPSIDSTAAARLQRLPLAASPWLHEEVAKRMQERLEIIKLVPKAWAHWEPLHGGTQAHALLARRYPDAQCFAVAGQSDHAKIASKLIATPWWKPARWTSTLKAATLRFEAPAAGAVQMLWANMALHGAADPQALIAEWHQALSVDGFLMFSCFGPDTLRELRGVYEQLGWPPAAHDFTDMHDWGDMLVASGFAEPVLDMERIVLTYETPERLLAELRTLGRNLHLARFPALRGRGWHARLLQAMKDKLADPADQGRLKLTFEVIYGHAIKPAKRLAMQSETRLSLDEMRQALKADKPARP